MRKNLPHTVKKFNNLYGRMVLIKNSALFLNDEAPSTSSTEPRLGTVTEWIYLKGRTAIFVSCEIVKNEDIFNFIEHTGNMLGKITVLCNGKLYKHIFMPEPKKDSTLQTQSYIDTLIDGVDDKTLKSMLDFINVEKVQKFLSASKQSLDEIDKWIYNYYALHGTSYNDYKSPQLRYRNRSILDKGEYYFRVKSHVAAYEIDCTSENSGQVPMEIKKSSNYLHLYGSDMVYPLGFRRLASTRKITFIFHSKNSIWGFDFDTKTKGRNRVGFSDHFEVKKIQGV